MAAPIEVRALRVAASVEPLGTGRYSANLSSFYTVMNHPHGGYLQCVIANAALAQVAEEGSTHVDVTSITTNFINAPSPGEAELRAEVRRSGRSASFVYVALFQGDVLMSESLLTLGILRDSSRIRYQDAHAPDMADLEACPVSTAPEEVSLMKVLDVRLDPSTSGWWDGQLSSQAELRGWLRLDDGEASWTTWSLLFASDALPPATLPLGSSGWVPTLQLTTYVRRVPTSEWLRAQQRAIVIADSIVDERCELFDEAGQLVASSTQIALVRLPGSS